MNLENQLEFLLKRFPEYGIEQKCIHPVNQELQKGPTCGLLVTRLILHLMFHCDKRVNETINRSIGTDSTVNFSISSGNIQPFNIPTLEDLVISAKSKGFTRHGEFFSTQDLLDFILDTLNAVFIDFHGSSSFWNSSFSNSEIINEKHLVQLGSWPESDQQFIDFIDGGGVIAVAYDRDKNNSPCNAKGTKAHWCLINGYILLRPTSYIQQSNVNDMSLSSSSCNHDGQKLLSSTKSKLYIVASHGKSIYPGIWSFHDLKSSNLQLEKVDKRVLNSEKRYKLVDDDGRLALKNQLLYISVPRMELG